MQIKKQILRHAFLLRIAVLLLSCVLLPMLVINFVWHHVSANNLKKEAVENSRDLMKLIDVNISNYVSDINSGVVNALLNDDIKGFLYSGKELNETEREERKKILRGKLNQLMNNNTMIASVTVVEDYYSVSTAQNVDYEVLKNKDWFQKFRRYGKIEDFTGVYYNDFIKDSNGKEPVFAYLMRLKHPYLDYTIGVAVVELRYSRISQLFADVNKESTDQWFLYDNDQMIYSPDGYSDELDAEEKQLLQTVDNSDEAVDFCYKGKESIVLQRKIYPADWILVGVIDETELLSSINMALGQVNSRLIIFVLAVMIVIIFILYRMLLPLSEIEAYMKKVEENRFDIRFPDVSEDEFGRIKNGFNKMIGHIDKLLTNIETSEKEKREIAVKVLRAQIDPHFLYNTLNIIRWSAVMAGDNKVSQMIVALIRTIEFNGKRKEEFVTVKDELDNVKNYVQLLKYHYEDKFDVEYQLDEQAMDYYMPKMLLQPLVENAVFHGLIPKETEGKIQIHVSLKDEHIHFQVKDNGIGAEGKENEQFYKGIGVSNVHARLCYYFGEECGLKITNIPGAGVTVCFMIPVIQSLPYYKAVIQQQEDEKC